MTTISKQAIAAGKSHVARARRVVLDWCGLDVEDADLDLKLVDAIASALDEVGGAPWETGEPPKDGTEIIVGIDFTARAYWDPELKTFVLCQSLKVETVDDPKRWRRA